MFSVAPRGLSKSPFPSFFFFGWWHVFSNRPRRCFVVQGSRKTPEKTRNRGSLAVLGTIFSLGPGSLGTCPKPHENRPPYFIFELAKPLRKVFLKNPRIPFSCTNSRTRRCGSVKKMHGAPIWRFRGPAGGERVTGVFGVSPSERWGPGLCLRVRSARPRGVLDLLGPWTRVAGA